MELSIGYKGKIIITKGTNANLKVVSLEFRRSRDLGLRTSSC